MKKTISILVLAFATIMLLSCAGNSQDKFGYVAPPPDADQYSNEPGLLQQPGGVSAEITQEQGGMNSQGDIKVGI
jgi:hypothetical protein